jgi:hypothetical protein
MFSFHKPKIYRSLSGCCICKAKSSSSRFTDSKKYESEFEKCFRIIEKRSGEICNACVLLVKRWKKLPSGTTRNWHHVVDARAGPGTKSMKSKINNNNNDNNNSSTTTSLNHNQHHRIHHHNSHRKLLKPKNTKDMIASGSNISTDIRGDDNLNDLAVVRSLIPSPDASDSSDLEDEIEEDIDDMEDEIEVEEINKKTIEGSNNFKSSLDEGSKKSNLNANKRNNSESDSPTNIANKISSFLDMSFWRKEKICCGVIFTGPDNEVLIYPKLLEPCFCRKNKLDLIKSKLTANVNSGSSDSGSVGSLLIEDDASSNASSGNNCLT